MAAEAEAKAKKAAKAKEQEDATTLAERIASLFDEGAPLEAFADAAEPLLDALDEREWLAWAVVAVPAAILLAPLALLLPMLLRLLQGQEGLLVLPVLLVKHMGLLAPAAAQAALPAAAPDFTLRTADGQNLRLQEQRGERLLVACSLLLAGLQAACTYVVWAAAVAQAREQRKRAD